MKLFIGLVALAALGVTSIGCGKQGAQASRTESSTKPSPAPAPAKGEGTAVASVVPGSYEDWCEEHGVPETACTRCDPSLIPAFKAVNDWDEELGLPMSLCLKHNPGLKITRPPKPGGK